MYNMDVDLAQARKTLSQLIARVGDGETITLTRYGKPVAQLGPVSKAVLSADHKEHLEHTKQAQRGRDDLLGRINRGR